MKARNKKTGEVVTNFSISKEWGTASYIDSANTLRFSTPLDGEWEMIGEDESEPVDWSPSAERRRRTFSIRLSVLPQKYMNLTLWTKGFVANKQ